MGTQLGREFTDLVPTIDLDTKLISSVREDFADQQYMQKAVAQLLGVLAPTYRLPQDYHFELFKEGNAFRLDTNIDFEQANEIFTQREPKAGYTLTPDRLNDSPYSTPETTSSSRRGKKRSLQRNQSVLLLSMRNFTKS